MMAMSATSSIQLAHGRPFTVVDLEGMPDDGNRYELIDGMLLVSPAPGARHQKALLLLAMRLEAASPDDMHVLPAPFSVRPSNSTELQPDVLVTRDEDLTEKFLPVAPLLAVEVLSPSTAINDLNNKKAAYERMGVASYWVIDPEEPSIIVFELDERGRYQRVAEVTGSDAWKAERPFPVRIVPANLLGNLAK